MSSQDPDRESDDVYGLVSVLYHALQGATAVRICISDADEAGRGELARFFARCREQDAERVKEAKRLLAPLIAEPRGQVSELSSATFAPGDGADDSEISANEERGKPGNWPAL